MGPGAGRPHTRLVRTPESQWKQGPLSKQGGEGLGLEIGVPPQAGSALGVLSQPGEPGCTKH